MSLLTSSTFLPTLQNYAVRLANAQARRKEASAAQPPTAEAAQLSTAAHAPTAAQPAVASGGSGKIRLLRRQLEDAQMKEREERDRALDLEQLVRDLQRDLASREDTIQRMREEQFSVASFREEEDDDGDGNNSPFVMANM